MKSKYKAEIPINPEIRAMIQIMNPADVPIKFASAHSPKRELVIAKIIIIPKRTPNPKKATFRMFFLFMTLIINY